MESNFDKYIRKSDCEMNDCPYGYDLSCVDCVNRMIEEHDEKVKSDAVKEFAEWLSNTELVTSQGHFILPLRGSYSVDEVVDMWEKEQENE